jgi:L-threonylcarbamoyladenylate synthase
VITIPYATAADRMAARAALRTHLRTGGCIAYPTETVYGLGCALDPAALQVLGELKRRDSDRPFLILIGEADFSGVEWTPAARALAEAFWPGPLTLALAADADRFPGQVLSPDGTLAVRRSSSPAVAAILDALGEPVTSTSANAPGLAPALDAGGAAAAVRALGGDDCFCILDGGTLPASPPSTLVRAVGDRAEIVREGAIGTADILRVLGTANVD